MVPEQFDRTAAKPVIWSPAPAGLRHAGQGRHPGWLTSLAAAGLTLIVFMLALVVLAALLLPGAA